MTNNEEKNEVMELIEAIPYTSKKRQANRERAIEKGFTDEYHMEGWLYFNKLSSPIYNGLELDILHKADGGLDE